MKDLGVVSLALFTFTSILNYLILCGDWNSRFPEAKARNRATALFMVVVGFIIAPILSLSLIYYTRLEYGLDY